MLGQALECRSVWPPKPRFFSPCLTASQKHQGLLYLFSASVLCWINAFWLALQTLPPKRCCASNGILRLSGKPHSLKLNINWKDLPNPQVGIGLWTAKTAQDFWPLPDMPEKEGDFSLTIKIWRYQGIWAWALKSTGVQLLIQPLTSSISLGKLLNFSKSVLSSLKKRKRSNT